MMQTFVRPSRDLRNHYAEISEMLKDHNHVIITNVAEALAKAKQQAADPDTQWEDHESVWETLSKQYDV